MQLQADYISVQSGYVRLRVSMWRRRSIFRGRRIRRLERSGLGGSSIRCRSTSCVQVQAFR